MGVVLLQKPPPALKDRLLQSCHLKRFFECWMADPTFRSELEYDPQGATTRRGLKTGPTTLREIWPWIAAYATENGTIPQVQKLGSPPAELVEFHALKDAERGYQQKLRENGKPITPRWDNWRARQISRMASQFSPGLTQAILHPPFACEISRGCSVGCWFCGVGALRSDRQFEYSPENAALWRDVLLVLRRFTGAKAGGQGFLFWATDPLDNPDYEHFAKDFRHVFGRFPDLTTAQAARQLSRVRRLIELSIITNEYFVRLSTLSVRHLYAIHAEFTPEELATVSIFPRNKGSVTPLAMSGKARDIAGSKANESKARADETIACVSGFLINMVERSVQLVTPCPASDRWPLGYVVYERAGFADCRELEAIIERMIATYMHTHVPLWMPVRFRSDLKCTFLSDGFCIRSPHAEITVRGNPLLELLGQIIDRGDSSCQGIIQRFAEEFFVDEHIINRWIDLLFQNGVLDEEQLFVGGRPS